MLISNRANTILLVLLLAVGLGIVAMLATDARGGPLDPPAAPNSTDGVREPGTPISSVPYTITQPGRYYLTRNLSYLASGDAITITADNVVLDLGGFTLDGNNIGSTGVSDGFPAGTNVSVQHGVVRGFFNKGIFLGNITSGYIRDISVIGDFSGIWTQHQGLLEDCDVKARDSFGVVLGDQSIMRRCHVHDTNTGVNASANSVIEENVIEFAASKGVEAVGKNVTVRNNRFLKNGPPPTYNLDVVASNGAAVVIDNVLDCTTSLSATGTGQLVTASQSGEHTNIPIYAGPTFC